MLPENETQIRERVKALKEFYTNLVVYAAICLACIIIWLSTGGGFWPIWVIFGLAISVGFQGLRLGIFPMISDILPFLKPEWEEDQIKSMMSEAENHHPPLMQTKSKKQPPKSTELE